MAASALNITRFAIRQSITRPTTFIAPKLYSRYSLHHRDSFIATEPTIWDSLVPKFLRTRRNKDNPSVEKRLRSKEWNPYTFFIIIFLLIGSNSINLIALRRDLLNYSRMADTKLAALNEAIERVHRGEDVDVKQLLGTEDPKEEKEWEEGTLTNPFMIEDFTNVYLVLKEIEAENSAPELPEAKAEKGANHNTVKQRSLSGNSNKHTNSPPKDQRPPGFY
jgi:hypothetical protein